MSETTLVIIHTLPIFLGGLQRHFDEHPHFRVVGTATNGQQAIQVVDYAEPRLMVMEVDLPGINGIEVARTVKLSHPGIGIILLSDINDHDGIVKSIRAGVAAYVSRTTSWETLLTTVQQVRDGQYPINDLVLTDPAVAAAVMDAFRQIAVDVQTEHVYSPMSPREIQVLELVAAGQTNKEIALQLTISTQTVKNHISSILRKLAVNDRTQAVVFAMQRGWIRIMSAESTPSGY